MGMYILYELGKALQSQCHLEGKADNSQHGIALDCLEGLSPSPKTAHWHPAIGLKRRVCLVHCAWRSALHVKMCNLVARLQCTKVQTYLIEFEP